MKTVVNDAPLAMVPEHSNEELPSLGHTSPNSGHSVFLSLQNRAKLTATQSPNQPTSSSGSSAARTTKHVCVAQRQHRNPNSVNSNNNVGSLPLDLLMVQEVQPTALRTAVPVVLSAAAAPGGASERTWLGCFGNSSGTSYDENDSTGGVMLTTMVPRPGNNSRGSPCLSRTVTPAASSVTSIHDSSLSRFPSSPTPMDPALCLDSSSVFRSSTASSGGRLGSTSLTHMVDEVVNIVRSDNKGELLYR